jgi:hypothetical protein
VRIPIAGSLSRNPARRDRKSNGYIGSPKPAVQEKFDGFAGPDGKASEEARVEFSEKDAGN